MSPVPFKLNLTICILDENCFNTPIMTVNKNFTIFEILTKAAYKTSINACMLTFENVHQYTFTVRVSNSSKIFLLLPLNVSFVKHLTNPNNTL